MSSVLVDPREGSKNLFPVLQELGVSSRLERLEYGDVQVEGRGPEERPVLVGVEVKAPSDLLNSIRSGRFAGHQLPGLVSSYEQTYLVVEGLPYRRDSGEAAWVGRRVRGHWRYDDLVGHLLTYENKTGVRPMFTKNRRATAEWIAALWKWWNGKAWEKHRSHLAKYNPDPPHEAWQVYRLNPALETRIKVARDLADGVGWEKAKKAAEHFRSVREMVNAEAEEWMKIKGFGKALAQRMVAEARRI
jgi:ERCC4-type nuclease